MQGYRLLFRSTNEVTQDALPHIAQVNGTSCQGGIIELLHLAHSLVDPLLP